VTITDKAPAEDPSDEVVSWYTNLRETDPVRRDDNGIWHLFRHADVSAALSDSATFSSDTTKFAPKPDEFESFGEGDIFAMDQPKHKNLRGLVVEVFTPKVVDSLAPRITEVTNQLLDETEDAGGRFDLVDVLTYQLPVIVIAELLGVPSSDRPMFRRWAHGLLEPGKAGEEQLRPEDVLAAVAPIMREMGGYLREQINRRRTTPTHDLMGKLVRAEANGKRLTDTEIVGFSIVLLLAGHITTTALLGNAVYCLDKYPHAATDLRADPGLLPGAIEEVLRFRTPLPVLSRVTTTEATFGGTTIPADQLVVSWLASANRDPAKFAEPDVFDIRRKTTGHLAFGHGIHFCIGSRLARLEARIALGILFDRYREIAVDHEQPIDFQNPWRMNTIASLPVIVRR
jgi:cytochrome P450